jgi:hypothetical protein
MPRRLKRTGTSASQGIATRVSKQKNWPWPYLKTVMLYESVMNKIRIDLNESLDRD